MNNHNFDYVLDQYDNEKYVQHNRNIPDGLEGLVGFMRQLTKDYPDYSYEVKQIYTNGAFVIFHSHAILKIDHRGNDRKGINVVDS